LPCRRVENVGLVRRQRVIVRQRCRLVPVAVEWWSTRVGWGNDSVWFVWFT
jgi:hypothetical protein